MSHVSTPAPGGRSRPHLSLREGLEKPPFPLALYCVGSVLAVKGPLRRFAPWTAPGRSERRGVDGGDGPQNDSVQRTGHGCQGRNILEVVNTRINGAQAVHLSPGEPLRSTKREGAVGEPEVEAGFSAEGVAALGIVRYCPENSGHLTKRCPDGMRIGVCVWAIGINLRLD